MAEGLGGVGQRVGPLDHGDELSGFDERREGFGPPPWSRTPWFILEEPTLDRVGGLLHLWGIDQDDVLRARQATAFFYTQSSGVFPSP